MNIRTKYWVVSLVYFVSVPAYGRDVLLEFKAAYFLPTNDTFKDIYGGGAIYGPEVTGQLYKRLYGFTSVNFFNNHGKSIGLCNPTTVKLVTLGLGLKYLIPSIYGTWYIGLGIVPTRLHTHDYSPFVAPFSTRWTCGGVTKAGVYIDLRHSLFLDLFFDYSFARVKPKCVSGIQVEQHAAYPNGCSFGAGLGYRFN